MKKLRLNLFNQVHKGLRALLYDTALSIQHTDFSQEAQAKATFRKVEKVLWLFEGHATIEDSKVFPLLNDVAPDVVDDFEQQHETDHKLGHNLQNTIVAYDFATTDTDRVHAGVHLQRAFDEFTAFNLQHMNREETTINELLWKHYSEEQLLALQHGIVSSIPPDKNEWYSRWMIKGINDPEMIGWLQKVQQTAPPPVFKGLCAMAEQELPAERWKAILDYMEQDVFIVY
jgi:Hemerythrin HHE cation binding domain